MSTALPKKLKNEPLIDAVFEIRFHGTAPASNILPGYLFSKLDGDKKIEKLPAGQLPEVVRQNDPNLKYAPVVRILWKTFGIQISDNGLSVACFIPYPGWTAFRETISLVIDHLASAGIVHKVERYSIKYVDIIPAKTLTEQISAVNLDLTIGSHKLKKEFFQVRVDVPIDDLINIITINSSAEITLPSGEQKKGIVVDIDTIMNIDNSSIGEVVSSIADNIQRMHDINGELFFSCLKKETIEMLEPIYE